MSDLFHDDTELSRKVFDKLPQNKYWSYEDFRQSIVILSTLSVLETPRYIPYAKIPLSIHLEGLKDSIGQLRDLTSKNGNEHSRAVLADVGRQKFVLSKKIIVGTSSSAHLDWTKEPNRELYQRRALSIHTHPIGPDGLAMGFSDTDYRTFMSDPEQAGMIITFGQSIFMMLKTSSTPTKLEQKDIDRRVQDELDNYRDLVRKEKAERPGSNFSAYVRNFVELNKGLCRNFGLALYTAGPEQRLQLEKVSLAQ